MFQSQVTVCSTNHLTIIYYPEAIFPESVSFSLNAFSQFISCRIHYICLQDPSLVLTLKCSPESNCTKQKVTAIYMIKNTNKVYFITWWRGHENLDECVLKQIHLDCSINVLFNKYISQWLYVLGMAGMYWSAAIVVEHSHHPDISFLIKTILAHHW